MEDESSDDELQEHRHWLHDPDGQAWSLKEAPVPKKRGRPKIPQKWTRVISITHDSPLDLAVYEIDKDKATIDERLPYPRAQRATLEPWKILFLPKEYAANHPNLNLEGYQLTNWKLKTLGVEVTKMRRALREKALEMQLRTAKELEEDINSVSLLAKRIDRGEYKPVTKEQLLAIPDFEDEVAPGKRRRSKKRGPLLLDEKLDILQRVLVSFESHKEVASAYRVSKAVVASLIFKVKKKPAILAEVHCRQQAKQSREDAVSKVVDELNERNVVIDKAQQV